MRKIAAVERGANGADHAVHHPAGGHDTGACLCVADRLPGQQLQRGVVVHVHSTRMIVDDAAVTVIGVFAKADIGNDEQVRCCVLRGLHRLLHDAAVAVRIAALRILLSRDAEENNASQAETGRLAGLFSYQIDRKLGLPRHRVDRLLDALSRPREKRKNQLRRIDRRLAEQTADGRMIAQPPQASCGKTGIGHYSVIIQPDQGANVFAIRQALAK